MAFPRRESTIYIPSRPSRQHVHMHTGRKKATCTTYRRAVRDMHEAWRFWLWLTWMKPVLCSGMKSTWHTCSRPQINCREDVTRERVIIFCSLSVRRSRLNNFKTLTQECTFLVNRIEPLFIYFNQSRTIKFAFPNLWRWTFTYLTLSFFSPDKIFYSIIILCSNTSTDGN